MTTTFHVGKRLSYDGALCTIRYHGPLTGAKGDWLGIEWDKVDRGKHDGSHQGQTVFHCLSNSTTAASFVRSTRVPDPTRTVLEALKYKYGSKWALNGSRRTALSSEADIVHISGKMVEEVGFDKIQEQIGHFEDLKIVLLDDLNIIGLTRDESLQAKELASEEFGKTCPNITELDLGWNLFEHWQDIADICKHLPKLRVLKTSGLRLSSFSIATEGPNSPFPLVEELHLNETLLTPDQILNILNCTTTKAAFPKLHTLSISLNEFTSFTTYQPHLIIPTITTLILENNAFTNLHPLTTIFHHFPSLTILSLQSNTISSLTLTSPTTFPTLTHLSLASNSFPTYTTLTCLPLLFPSLTSLRTTKNPFNTNPTLSNTSSDAPYYLTLARIPSLRMLNYTTITAREREEGEIYYLSIAEKDISSIIVTQGRDEGVKYAKREYSRYNELCEKYDRGNILAIPSITADGGGTTSAVIAETHPQGSLASRVVTCSFYIPRECLGLSNSDTDNDNKDVSSELTFTRPIPYTIDVYTFKSLISRYLGLAPLQFRAVYESEELDPIPETTRKGNWGSAAGTGGKGIGSGGGDGGSGGGDGGSGGSGSKEDMLKERDREWTRWGEWDVDIPLTLTDDVGATMLGWNGLGKDGKEGEGDGVGTEGYWVDGVLYRDGVRWKRRETEIVDGRRAWGDFLDGGERVVRIRVEPIYRGWEKGVERRRWRRQIGGGNVNANGGGG